MGQSIVIHGLIKKRAEIAGQHKAAVKAADAIKGDLDAIDRALQLCGYQGDPKSAQQNLMQRTAKIRFPPFAANYANDCFAGQTGP